MEESKKITSNDVDNEPKKKNFGRLFLFTFLIVVFLFSALLYQFPLYKELIFNLFKQEKNIILPKDEADESVIDEREFEKIVKSNDLEETEISTNEISIQELKNELEQIKAKLNERDVNTYSGEIIKIVLDIQGNIRHFKSYDSNLELLKNFPLSSTIQQKIKVLEHYKDYNLSETTIKMDFKTELSEFLVENNMLSKNSNKFIKFISNFIVIRDKSDSEIDIIITDLENNINKNNYDNAYKVLENNNYLISSFQKTHENLELLTTLHETINDIVSNLLKGDDA